MIQGTGTVTFFDPKANYGFIDADDGGADIVFQLLPGDPAVATGEGVGFELIPRPSVTPRGREALRIWKLGFNEAVA